MAVVEELITVPRMRRERIWTFVFLDIIALSMLDSIVCHALYGALPLYVESLGGKAAFSGLLTAVFAVAAGVGRILTGAFASRFGCRIVLIWGAILLALANLTPLALPGLGILLGVRFLQGVGFSGISTASANASAEVVPPARLGEGMGYYGLGQSISSVLGPSLGYFLFHYGQESVWGNNILWYAMTAISLTLIGLAYVCCYTPRKNIQNSSSSNLNATSSLNGESLTESSSSSQMEGQEASGGLIRIFRSFYEHKALGMALVCGNFMFAASFYSSFLMLFAQRNGISNPQMFFLGTAIAMFAVRLFAGKLGDQFPPLMVLLPSLGIGLFSFWVTIFANSTSMLFFTGTLYGISVGIGFPLLNTLAYRLTEPSRWHASTATFFLGCDIGWAMGSYFWGVVIDWRGFTLALFLAGITMIISCMGAFIALYKKNTRVFSD